MLTFGRADRRQYAGNFIIPKALLILLDLARVLLADPVRSDVPPVVAPSAEAPVTQPRGFQEVAQELAVTANSLGTVTNLEDAFFDPSQRALAAPKALPILQRMVALGDEAVGMQPLAAGMIAKQKMEAWAMMSLLGDANAKAQIRKSSVSNHREEAVSAAAWEFVIRFATTSDPAIQKKALDDLIGLGEGNPENEMIAQTAFLVRQHSTGPMRMRVEKLIIGTLKSAMALQISQDLQNEARRQAILNKPLVLTGLTPDGKPFSTAGWQGKVVLVEFWASYSDPCLADQARMFKLYRENHDNGLEILGISCDNDPDDLKTFLRQNPGLVWPQLFDPDSAIKLRFHPLAHEYGVSAVPVVFLIDRKGIVRSVNAGPELPKLLPALLAEK